MSGNNGCFPDLRIVRGPYEDVATLLAQELAEVKIPVAEEVDYGSLSLPRGMDGLPCLEVTGMIGGSALVRGYSGWSFSLRFGEDEFRYRAWFRALPDIDCVTYPQTGFHTFTCNTPGALSFASQSLTNLWRERAA